MNNLPNELIQKILGYIDPVTLFRIVRISDQYKFGICVNRESYSFYCLEQKYFPKINVYVTNKGETCEIIKWLEKDVHTRLDHIENRLRM